MVFFGAFGMSFEYLDFGIFLQELVFEHIDGLIGPDKGLLIVIDSPFGFLKLLVEMGNFFMVKNIRLLLVFGSFLNFIEKAIVLDFQRISFQGQLVDLLVFENEQLLELLELVGLGLELAFEGQAFEFLLVEQILLLFEQ